MRYTRVILTEIYQLSGMKLCRDELIARTKTGRGCFVLASSKILYTVVYVWQGWLLMRLSREPGVDSHDNILYFSCSRIGESPDHPAPTWRSSTSPIHNSSQFFPNGLNVMCASHMDL